MGHAARRAEITPREALRRLSGDSAFMWWIKRPRLYRLYMRLTRAPREQRDATTLALAFAKTEICRRCGRGFTEHCPGRTSQSCQFT